EIGFAADRLTELVAEAQGVNEGGGVFDLAGAADHGGLAIAFDQVTAAAFGQDQRYQFIAKLRCDRQYLRPEILHEATLGPGIADDGSDRHHADRFDTAFAAFDEYVFDITDDLANLGSHDVTLL